MLDFSWIKLKSEVYLLMDVIFYLLKLKMLAVHRNIPSMIVREVPTIDVERDGLLMSLYFPPPQPSQNLFANECAG